MILLQANNVARRFADVTLYEQVNFNIQSGDRVALVGRNGTGKSTLIEQIMGQEPLSEGEITTAKNLRIGYLEQHVAINSNRTIWDEMMTVFKDRLALRDEAETLANQLADLADRTHSPEYQQTLAHYDQIQEQMIQNNVYAIESDIRTVLHGFIFYEEDYQRPVNSLSGGQKTRLALARTLLTDYDLLILDEPTNHLDMETLAWLENYLMSYRGALLLVSHDRYFLNKVAQQVIELRHKTLHTYAGNYDYYLKEKALRQQQEQQAYDKQQEEIAKLEDFIQKNITRASTTKRAQSRRKRLEKMERIEKPLQDQQAPRIQFSAAKESGQRVIDVNNLAIGYSASEAPLARHLNLELGRQEAIAIVGPNGVGKTTLLKTILGQIPALAGDIRLGSNVQIGYYDQNVNQLDPNLTVLETLWQAHDLTDEWQIRSILGSFLFSGETVEKKVGLLSGGEKARLSLALLATNHDNTLLLDEPTNHLDIDSKEVLEDALINYDGSLLFVSHDRYFINRIASKVLEIHPEGADLYLGDYDYYQAKKAELLQIAAAQEANQEDLMQTKTAPMSQNQRSYEDSKLLRQQLRKLEKQVEDSWQSNEALELELEQIEAKMAELAQANDSQALAQQHKEQLRVQAAIDQAVQAWEEAALNLEAFKEEHEL
ncbi:ATP-binding cassette domain-containing protein [Ignavigranum ruoffiae]|uniref:ABC-F family ATP-binding cassette domain-containing protein n=1 Tax=Ignavigranum ruoffiae TaxID=89093 RepID=UPI002064B615|nr:ABC-F family ATP-binding cassette domain-containing protein [Ignavigranum ruoffiae]UPQ86571.1 ATP-binding cassette domain-containing protein [Ignavigranum ruoffiae]